MQTEEEEEDELERWLRDLMKRRRLEEYLEYEEEERKRIRRKEI